MHIFITEGMNYKY